MALFFSLRKAARTLHALSDRFARKRSKFPESLQSELKDELAALARAIKNRKRKEAKERVKRLSSGPLKKSLWEQLRENSIALIAALGIAVLIRQMGFELYEIPSGSMRPTFKERDRLLVSKTAFGWNLPLMAAHLAFNPDRVSRNSTVTFTGKDMDIRDVDTRYFYLFPGKKQFVKRIIGKPGDVLYFYGGKIYGIDAQGNDISQELQSLDIEHIPFIDFGRKTRSDGKSITFYQMNTPIAKLHAARPGVYFGEMLDHEGAAKEVYDLWGMGNFGMARLLTEREVTSFAGQEPQDAPLYLEIKHHPSIATAHIHNDEFGNLHPFLGVKTSLVPLQEEHLHRLWEHMNTSRFVVAKGIAYRPEGSAAFGQKLSGVPDGTYEFFAGKGYAVKWQGIVEELPASHPLMQFSPERVQTFFNLGMEWDVRVHPIASDQRFVPARYAYFREGDLYLLGAPILKKNDPVLEAFIQRENAHPLPFVDRGPPINADGALDSAFVQRFGLTIPGKMYFVLGDNHANSGDSREFGFVPEGNLRGTPVLLFWPPGARWGVPLQRSAAGIGVHTLLFWAVVGCSVGIALFVRKRTRAIGTRDVHTPQTLEEEH